MKFGWRVVALAGFAVIAANPALARTKHHKMHTACVTRPQPFTWGEIITDRTPRPNGCSPAVYQYGRYVGQDPDPFIRQQLLRDPQTGYSQF